MNAPIVIDRPADKKKKVAVLQFYNTKGVSRVTLTNPFTNTKLVPPWGGGAAFGDSGREIEGEENGERRKRRQRNRRDCTVGMCVSVR